MVRSASCSAVKKRSKEKQLEKELADLPSRYGASSILDAGLKWERLREIRYYVYRKEQADIEQAMLEAELCIASLEQLNWEDADLLIKYESARKSLLIFLLKEERASLVKECSDLKNQKHQLDAKRAVVEAEVCEKLIEQLKRKSAELTALFEAAEMVVLGPSYKKEQRDAMKNIKDGFLEERRQVNLKQSILMAELKAPCRGGTTLSQRLSALKDAKERPLPRLMDLDKTYPPDHDARWSAVLNECT